MIAQVYVDVGVPQLDRPFDYAIPGELEDQVRSGIRVKVRFNGRLLSGFVVGVVEDSDQERLVDIAKVVSSEVVLPPESASLIRAVADHCAGTFMDVARLAIPPRYARAEKTPVIPPVVEMPPPVILTKSGSRGSDGGDPDDVRVTGGDDGDPDDVRVTPGCCIDSYPLGTSLRAAIRTGKNPRVAWSVVPVADSVGDWADGVAGLVADTVASGRGVLILVPDAKDCKKVSTAITNVVGATKIVSLSADKGPGARYSAFLAAVRGQAQIVVGTRAAVYTPVGDLGLILVWEEADSSFAEQHFPYPALRDIVAIRATQAHCGVVFASHSRSTEIQSWIDKGWLREIVMPSAQVMFHAPQMRIASQDDRSLDRDPAARASRLPHDVFSVIQTGVKSGPVLVWVPWVGRRRNFICSGCGQPMRCVCGGGFVENESGVLACQICGRSAAGWVCPCGSKRWRAQTIGSERTAAELAEAFKNLPVLRSDSSSRLDCLPDTPAIVISTPGCEPEVESGYAAGVILDALGFLSRPDIRVGEEAVRRWLDAASFVRSGRDGGTVMLVGPGGDRALQAVLRLDPVGFARRELQDRIEAGFPPATRMAMFSGDETSVAATADLLAEAGYVEVLGPIQEIDSQDFRLIARVPAGNGEEFASLLARMTAQRSQGKKQGTLTWRLDPQWLGG